MADSDAFVRFTGVVAGYGGGDVLKGVSFDVPKGCLLYTSRCV